MIYVCRIALASMEIYNQMNAYIMWQLWDLDYLWEINIELLAYVQHNMFS